MRPILAVACVATLATACAEQQGREPPHAPIVQDGAIYTPADVGPLGCVLYSIEIPGFHTPAALVYRNDDGSFSYARPERCEKTEEKR